MWDSSRYLCSPERPRASALGSKSRKKRKNHTYKLHELALLLPMALKTGTKKLTKKEILLHVLHYIQYLQRSIDVVQALLKLHTINGEGGLGELGQNPAVDPTRRRHSTLSSAPHSFKSCLQGACCREPRKKKKKLSRASEHCAQAQNSRSCLALDKPRKQVTSSPDQKGGNMGEIPTLTRCLDSCIRSKAALSQPQGDRKEGKPWLTLLDMTKNSIHCDISSCYCKNRAQDEGLYPTFEAQQGIERNHFLNRTQPFARQKMVFYDSNEEVKQESADTDPWLPAWTPEDNPPGSPLALGPPQIVNWSEKGLPSEILGLSPSLFSSPEKLPENTLDNGNEYLTQVLFEDAFLDPVSSPSACMREVPQQDAQADPESPQPSSKENGDYMWTPTPGTSTLTATRGNIRKLPAGGHPVKTKEKTAPCSTQMKKKCVNGFIMFCRMNRKHYIRSCPGTASTTATKELAQLWQTMTEQERKPYCIKARRFSRMHNRIVKQESSSSEDEDWGTPKPFYQLLAERARYSSKPPSLRPRCHKC